MHTGEPRQYLTFTRREWLPILVYAGALPLGYLYDPAPQANWASPFDAALSGLPDVGTFLPMVTCGAAFVTVLRLMIEVLYGLMRPYPALSETRVLGALAHWAARWVSVIVVALASSAVAASLGPDHAWF